jgi:hypothetical protein
MDEVPAGPDRPVTPPADPEEWTDDQWLAWLADTDDVVGDPVRRPTGRVTRTSGGQVLGNAMLGVANALYGREAPRVVVVAEAPGRPEDDPFDLQLDPDHPDRSVVVVRKPPRHPT